MKHVLSFRQDPEELKLPGFPNAGLIPWRYNQVTIAKEYFHAWIFSTIGKELPISGNPIKSIVITEDSLIVTFEDDVKEVAK